jgi:serine/threonine protein kinase
VKKLSLRFRRFSVVTSLSVEKPTRARVVLFLVRRNQTIHTRPRPPSPSAMVSLQNTDVTPQHETASARTVLRRNLFNEAWSKFHGAERGRRLEDGPFLDMWPTPNHQVDEEFDQRFELLGEIWQGADGHIRLYFDRTENHKVIIKSFPHTRQYHLIDPSAVQEMCALHAMGGQQDGMVPELLGVWMRLGSVDLVMRFVGPSISSLFLGVWYQQPVTEAFAAYLAFCWLSVVQRAMNHGVLLGDVKCQNATMNAAGVWIIDFASSGFFLPGNVPCFSSLPVSWLSAPEAHLNPPKQTVKSTLYAVSMAVKDLLAPENLSEAARSFFHVTLEEDHDARCTLEEALAHAWLAEPEIQAEEDAQGGEQEGALEVAQKIVTIAPRAAAGCCCSCAGV